MKIIFTLLACLLFCMPKTLAQDNGSKKIDSLLKLAKQSQTDTIKAKHYLEIATGYRRLSLSDSARFYFEQSIRELEGTNNKEILWRVVHQLSIFENVEGNFEKALDLANEGSSIAIELKDGAKLAENYRRKATSYLDKGDYKGAIEQTLLAAGTIDTLTPPDPEKKAKILGYLARIDILRGNYKAALTPLKEALEIFNQLENKHWQATLLMEMGNLNWYIEDFDTAMEYYQQSLGISKEMDNKTFVSMNLNNIALLHQSLGHYDLALETYFESQKLDKQMGSVNNSIIGLNNIANTYLSKKDFRNAISYYTQAIRRADSIQSLDIIRDGYSGRSSAYEKIGDFKRALADQRKYQKVNDSIFNTTKSKQIEELKTVYETEKKEQQILLQDKEITVLEQEAKISNQQKLLLGGGLGLSFLALGFGFYGFRQKIKRSKLEKEKVDAELAFKKKELTTHALHLAKKNEVLENVKEKAKALKDKDGVSGYQELIKTINFDQQDDKNWESFTQYFEQVHKNFASNAKNKYPDISKNELRFMALLKMNLSSKEIATILNISPDGIKKARQRLRKKMGLTPQDSLENTVLSI